MKAVRAIASRSRAAASLALARARAATARAAAARRGAEPEAFSKEGGAGATRARASPSQAAPSEDRPPARLLRFPRATPRPRTRGGGPRSQPSCAAALERGEDGSVSLRSSSSSRPGWHAKSATRAVRRPRASNRRSRFRLKVAHLGLMWKHHALSVVAAADPQAASSSSKRPSRAKSKARAWNGATREA